MIELNADGTDYLAHGDFQDEEFTRNWDRLRALLADASGKRTRKQILLDWPEGADLPGEVTLWRWLERAVAQGLVVQEGSGRRNDPYRYWLPGREAQWDDDRLPDLEALLAEMQQIPGVRPKPARNK